MWWTTEFFDTAYYHCLQYTVNKKLHWFERLFWLFWIVASMVGVVFLVSQSVQTFRSLEAPIRVRTDYLDFATPFPAVIFCEKREIAGKVDRMLIELNFSLAINTSIMDITSFVRSATFIRPGNPDPKIRTCNDPEKDFCRFSLLYRENLDAFAKYIRATCDETFTSCTFNDKPFNCCQTFLQVNTFEGLCYAFNSFNAIIEHRLRTGQHTRSLENRQAQITTPLVYQYLPYKLSHAGEQNPARLSVEVRHSELYVWYMGNTNVPSKMYQKENQLYLNEIKTVRSTDLFLRVQEVVPDSSILHLAEQRRMCKFWHENDNLTAFNTYSNSACEIECLRRAQLMYCKCIVHLLPRPINKYVREPYCNREGIKCTTEHVELLKYLQENCTCVSNCHLFDVFAIGKVSYEKKVNFRNENTTNRINFIVRAPTVQYVRYVAQDSLNFIVSIGGAITLFIGCSFLSVAQVFYHFLLKPFGERYLTRTNTQKKN